MENSLYDGTENIDNAATTQKEMVKKNIDIVKFSFSFLWFWRIVYMTALKTQTIQLPHKKWKNKRWRKLTLLNFPFCFFVENSLYDGAENIENATTTQKVEEQTLKKISTLLNFPFCFFVSGE